MKNTKQSFWLGPRKHYINVENHGHHPAFGRGNKVVRNGY